MATESQILSSFSPRACPRCMLTCFSAGDRDSSTNQLLFMQNKPNFRKDQMKVNIYYTKAYNNETAFRRGKNKPNSNPIKACFFLDPNIKELIVIFYKYVIIRNSLKRLSY